MLQSEATNLDTALALQRPTMLDEHGAALERKVARMETTLEAKDADALAKHETMRLTLPTAQLPSTAAYRAAGCIGFALAATLVDIGRTGRTAG
eukprot:SAG22_NODE_13959_length_389_cov_1.248276_1_plen_93_part_01